MTKKERRAENLKLRAQIENRTQLDEKMREILISQPFFKNAKTVMIYLSYRSEPDTFEIVKHLLSKGVRVCAPVCRENGQMDAFAFSSVSDLAPSAMGILEPPTDALVSPEKIDLIIVPGCGFTENGHRLGYGGGYYDRYLPNTRATTCGLLYECLKTDFTADETDVPLDYIITEERLYSFSRK